MKLSGIIDLLLRELNEAIAKQSTNGSFKHGHNGPYSDVETPIRNTAHFLYSLSAMYELTGNVSFKHSAEKSFAYLANNENIGNDGVYICRLSGRKDSTNGVIGHAWIIEGLLRARNIVGDEAIDIAERLWKLHKFDYSLSAWAKPSVGSSNVVFDHTFNHQLWFAACIAPLKLPEIDKQIKCFIKNNIGRLETYSDGVIYHRTPVGGLLGWLGKDFALGLRKILSPIKNRSKKKQMYLHSAGYHTFNLYALAMLYESGYGDEIDAAVSTNTLLQCLRNGELKEKLIQLPNIGIRYNPSGVEAAYALKVMGDESDQELIDDWVEFQFEQTASEKGFLVKDSPDYATSAARVYEAIRLLSD